MTYRRATGAALVGLGVQLALSAAVGLTGLYAKCPALLGAAWHLVGGLAVWVVLVVLYYQHGQERAEALEVAGLVGDQAGGPGGGTGIFDEHEQELLRAKRRLAGLYRWGLSAVSVVVGLYLVAVGGLLWRVGQGAYEAGTLVEGAYAEGINTVVLMVVTLGTGFLAFITARYEAGMTKVPQWLVLRGGAGYLMGNFLVAVLAFVGAVAAHFGNAQVLGLLRLVVPGIMVLVGAEMLLGQVLSVYRPRRPGEVSRPAFDSRLLGWLTSPESIAKAIGDTINYQFGFEVSRSWFYQLISRSITPLVAFGLLVLIGSSSVVVVAPYEQAVVTRYGRRVEGASAAAGAVRGPGLCFKWPWPVERAERYPTGWVHQVRVGSMTGGGGHDGHDHGDDQSVLWSHQHGSAEQYLIVAPTPLGHTGRAHVDGDVGRTTGLSLIAAQVAVQYRVVDLLSYIESSEDAAGMVAAIADRRVNAYFLGRDIDSLLGAERSQVAEALRGRIQEDLDALGLGVQVVFVGVMGIHPPADEGVASAFLEQIDAIQERQGAIEQAKQEAGEALVSVAGSRDKAIQINDAILVLEDLASGVGGADADRLDRVSAQELAIERLLTGARGEAAQLIYEARADRWYRAITERAKADRFEAELMAFRQAPQYYRTKRYLDVLGEGLVDARKYIMSSKQVRDPVFQIDLKDAGSAIESIFEERQ